MGKLGPNRPRPLNGLRLVNGFNIRTIIDSYLSLAEKWMQIFKTSMGSKVTPTWQPEQLAAFLSDPTISEMEVPDWEY